MSTFIQGLAQDQVEQVRAATEDILEDTGFRVGHAGLRGLCRKAGAKVDEASALVRLPRALVRELLARAPAQFTICGVDGSQTVIGGETPPRYHAIVTDPWIIDYAGGGVRPPRLSDIIRHTALAQKLEPVAAISLMDYPVSDIDGPDSNLHAMRAHVLHHTRHHLLCPASVESLERWLRLGELLGDGRPPGDTRIMSVAVAIISPLVLSEMNGELLLRTCHSGLAVFPTICASAGATAPYSLASNVLLGNVETVFLACMTQLVRPGTPFLYRFAPSVADMRTMEALYYTLDKLTWNLASVQLGRSYGLPCSSECGGAMTARHDLQTGAESVLSMLTAHASGADFLTGIGSTCNAVGMSPEMMLVQLAWAEAAAHLRSPVRTEGGLPGAESIRDAGPGGQFLTDGMTLEFMRGGEFFQHPLLDYSGDVDDARSLMERAHEEVLRMTRNVQSPLPAKMQEEVQRFFREECGLPAG